MSVLVKIDNNIQATFRCSFTTCSQYSRYDSEQLPRLVFDMTRLSPPSQIQIAFARSPNSLVISNTFAIRSRSGDFYGLVRGSFLVSTWHLFLVQRDKVSRLHEYVLICTAYFAYFLLGTDFALSILVCSHCINLLSNRKHSQKASGQFARNTVHVTNPPGQPMLRGELAAICRLLRA
jgi:hypothetical protein